MSEAIDDLLAAASAEAREWFDRLPARTRKGAPGGMLWFVYMYPMYKNPVTEADKLFSSAVDTRDRGTL